jgi:hypothetical protein
MISTHSFILCTPRQGNPVDRTYYTPIATNLQRKARRVEAARAASLKSEERAMKFGQVGNRRASPDRLSGETKGGIAAALSLDACAGQKPCAGQCNSQLPLPIRRLRVTTAPVNASSVSIKVCGSGIEAAISPVRTARANAAVSLLSKACTPLAVLMSHAKVGPGANNVPDQ